MISLHDIHSILVRLEFPATKEEIIRQATAIGAAEGVIDRLRELPEYMYGSVDSAIDALRGLA